VSHIKAMPKLLLALAALKAVCAGITILVDFVLH